MDRQTIAAGWLTLRPFTPADIPASRRVAEKAGFLIEATLRRLRVRHGVRVDEWVGSLLRDEVMADPGYCGRGSSPEQRPGAANPALRPFQRR